MKVPIIGGVVFLLSGIAALAAVAMMSDTPPAVATATSADPTPAVEAPAGAIVLSVPDMHCEFACAPKVRETLAAVPGVEKVETDVEKQTATVFTGEGFDVEKAIAALSEADYSSEVISK